MKQQNFSKNEKPKLLKLNPLINSRVRKSQTVSYLTKTQKRLRSHQLENSYVAREIRNSQIFDISPGVLNTDLKILRTQISHLQAELRHIKNRQEVEISSIKSKFKGVLFNSNAQYLKMKDYWRSVYDVKT